MLRTDDSGAVVNGSISTLRDLTLQGHLVRIKLYLPEGPYLLNVDNTNVRGDHVCAESMWHVSDNGTHISSTVEWRYHLACTNGQLYVITSPFSRPDNYAAPTSASFGAREQDANQNYGSMENGTQAMLWYVKEIGSGKPVYSHYLDGSRVIGKLDHLIYMAKLGETRCVMRDRGYACTMNNIMLDEAAREVNGQSLNHIGQQFTDDALSFKMPPYYWFSSWTTTGRRDNSRWFVGTTQPRGHNNDFVALDWHVDSCWREVYQHDAYGFQISGSLEELIFLISLGHRVRFHYGNLVIEANSVRITEQTVIAQSLEEMNRREGTGGTQYLFNTQTMHKWTIAHTSGLVKTYTYRVSNMGFYRKERYEVAIRWMVDRRPWKRVFSTPPNPFSNNNIDDLLTAVRRGASIRFNVQQDVLAGFFFTNADNVRVDEATLTVTAQCLRHVSDKKDLVDGREYHVQDDPFYWMLMISSEGVMAMAAWLTATRSQLYEKVAPEANITWFAAF